MICTRGPEVVDLLGGFLVVITEGQRIITCPIPCGLVRGTFQGATAASIPGCNGSKHSRVQRQQAFQGATAASNVQLSKDMRRNCPKAVFTIVTIQCWSYVLVQVCSACMRTPAQATLPSTFARTGAHVHTHTRTCAYNHMHVCAHTHTQTGKLAHMHACTSKSHGTGPFGLILHSSRCNR